MELEKILLQSINGFQKKLGSFGGADSNQVSHQRARSWSATKSRQKKEIEDLRDQVRRLQLEVLKMKEENCELKSKLQVQANPRNTTLDFQLQEFLEQQGESDINLAVKRQLLLRKKPKISVL